MFSKAVKESWKEWLKSRLGLLFYSLVLCVVLYAICAYGVGDLLFPSNSGSRLAEPAPENVAASYEAQPFSSPRYFYGRPALTFLDPNLTPGNFDTDNLSQYSAQFRQKVAQYEGISPDQVPDDLVTFTTEGVDPNISVAAAEIQVPRIAKQRDLTPAEINQLITDSETKPVLGMMGEPQVNVFKLNLLLDEFGNADPAPSASASAASSSALAPVKTASASSSSK